MKIKRAAALCSVLALLVSLLSGCGEAPKLQGSSTHKGASPISAGDTAQDSYFTQVWHGDTDFSDMEYVHYELSDLDEYTAPIYRIAENGGTHEEFSSAEAALYNELYYIYNLYTLINLKSCADASDEYASEETVYAQELYYDASEAYWKAMHALAVSPYSELLEDIYGSTIISWFESYEPDGDEQREIYSTESRLIQEYYTLMSESEPDYDRIAQVYVELVALRNRDAELSGYSSYAEYAYESIYAKDYTPEDAEAVWQGSKEYIVPIMQLYGPDILDASAELYYSDKLDCTPESVLAAMDSVLPRLSDELYAAFEYMLDHGLYDIDVSPKKLNIGFTTLLYYYNEPFIFNAATGTYYDYTDMFHEFGHFANYFYTSSELLFGMSDNDLSELQSQGMEVLFTFFYDDLFGEEIGDTMRDDLLLNMIFSIVDGALYDEFQQRVYSEPELTAERVDEIFLELYQEYGYSLYDGCENEWKNISHNFEYPFYYISYAVSAIGALEIYDQCCEDWDAGLGRYLTAAAMDTEVYYYSEALEEAGFADIFDISTYADVANSLSLSLGR